MSAVTKNLKPLWERLTFPLIHLLDKCNIHPNFLTILGIAFTAVAVPLLAKGYFFWGGILILLGGICDALDGHLARATNKVSKFGALLDSTLDRIGDFLPLFGLALHFAEKLILLSIVLLNILFWFLVSYVKARMEGLGVKTDIGGLFERPERLAVLVSFLLLGWVEIGLFLTLIGSFITFLQRLWKGWKELNFGASPIP